MAAISVGVLTITGLYAAGRHVASLEALATTGYGQVLIAKSAVVAGALLLGGVNAMLLHPPLARPLARLLKKPIGWTPISKRRFARLVTVEATLAAIVLLATGVLTSAPTASGSEFAPGNRQPVAAMSAEVDDIVVTVAVKPNRPGDNIYVVHAASIQRPTPAPIDRVLLRFDFADGDFNTETITLDELEPGRFQAGGGELRLAGAWTVEAVVRRAGLPDAVAPFEWRLSAGSPADSALSDRPLEPILTAAAVLLLIALLGGGSAAWVLHRWPDSPIESNTAPSENEDPEEQRIPSFDPGEVAEILATAPSDAEDLGQTSIDERAELIGSERT
jgi:copper transport protein